MTTDHGDNLVAYNHDCYERLRDLNLKVREQTISMMNIHSAEWCRDFATISWNGGSRTGKTTWISESARLGDLVVCHSRHGQSLLHTLFDKNSECEVIRVTWEVDKIPPLKQPTYDRILVDTASMYNRRLLYDALYSKVHDGTLFVMLG